MNHNKTDVYKVAILFIGRILHHEKRFLFFYLTRKNKYDVFYSADDEPQAEIEKFKKLYNPIAICNDKITDPPDYEKYNPDNIHLSPKHFYGISRHYYNLKRVWNLMEQHIEKTGTKYDIIIKMRFDLRIGPFKLFKPYFNSIYIPFGGDYNGINDRFAYGDYEGMKKHMNIIDNVSYLIDNNLSFLNSEALTLANIIHGKIHVVRFETSHKIKR